ncbi:MAG TPA: 1,4-dihydroxy-6-naphthoate synthase [Planctomycetota bacterium]|nr:1,4-dihydroxy-6-naphthoate synthase [Planctomycetota bacterium]
MAALATAGVPTLDWKAAALRPRWAPFTVAAARELHFGFSPCPNDTFAFWGAVHGKVPTPGFRLLPRLEDIESLNRRVVEGLSPLPVTKLSIPALAHACSGYAVLSAGAALGFGCGPLVVRRADDLTIGTLAALRGRRIAIPGFHTTAFLLLGLFGPRQAHWLPMRFDEVMPAVARGDADAGLIIHEGRFTCGDHGLAVVADLGELWERDTGSPVPLGVIAARRDLDRTTFGALGAALRASVELARAEPGLPRAYVRRHASELDDAVCDRHIALYVNDFTQDLGARGRAAVDQLLARGRAAGLLVPGRSPWPEGA